MRRVFLVGSAVVALAIPASAVAMAFSGQAGAGTPVTCSKLSGSLVSNTVSVTGTKCKAKPPKGYGNLTGSASGLASGGNLTWANSDFITVGAPTLGTGTGKCAKGATNEEATGTITGTSSDAYDTALNGTSFSADVCITTKGAISLAKGSKATL